MIDDERTLALISALLTMQLAAALHPQKPDAAARAPCMRLQKKITDGPLQAQLNHLQRAPLPRLAVHQLWTVISNAAGGELHYV